MSELDGFFVTFPDGSTGTFQTKKAADKAQSAFAKNAAKAAKKTAKEAKQATKSASKAAKKANKEATKAAKKATEELAAAASKAASTFVPGNYLPIEGGGSSGSTKLSPLLVLAALAVVAFIILRKAKQS